MQTSAKNVPIFLFACSVPFYFFGLFSLHTDRGVKLVGSLRFWQMGLTGDYDPYQQYFYTRLANFAQAVVVLLIFSLLFMVVFFILAAVRDNNQRPGRGGTGLVCVCAVVFCILLYGCFD